MPTFSRTRVDALRFGNVWAHTRRTDDEAKAIPINFAAISVA